MAHFIGKVYGRSTGSASRLGTKDSGISASVSGWNLGATVRGFVFDGVDSVSIVLTAGSNAPGWSHDIGVFTREDLDDLVSGKKAFRMVDLPQKGE